MKASTTTTTTTTTRTRRLPEREPLVILGLDPGSRHTGWGVVERRGTRMVARDHGRIALPTGTSLSHRLVALGDALDEIVERHRPGVAVLESLFRGVNARSLIVLAQARGVLLATVARAGLEIQEYAPAEIKVAVTGSGRADKQQVAHMVRLILGLGKSAPMSADASDALAVAICFGQRARIDRLSGRNGRP